MAAAQEREQFYISVMIFHWIILWRAVAMNYHFKDESLDHTKSCQPSFSCGFSLFPMPPTPRRYKMQLSIPFGWHSCSLHLCRNGNKRLSSLPLPFIHHASQGLQGGLELTRYLGTRQGIFLLGFRNSQTTYLKTVARHTLGAALIWMISLFFKWGQNLKTFTKEGG